MMSPECAFVFELVRKRLVDMGYARPDMDFSVVVPFIKKRGCGGVIKPIPSGMGYMDSPTSAEGGHSMVGG